MATIKQKKAIANLVENGGNSSKAMREAGYSKAMAKNPKKLTESKGFKEAAKGIVEALELERQAILARLPKVRHKAKYRDLVDGLDKTTKNIQLLTGGRTSNDKITFSWQE